MHRKNTEYRPDIDGLRAVAVILVLLFHFGLGVPGGFIGVDVFFVISGFLITEVIRSACMSGKFSFYSFYARRLTRLHPALLATVCICLAVGYLIMDPAALASLAAAAKYSILSSSNFLFWNSQGYFDASAKMQPLLHTWSLSVEWQFYLIWPLIVWASLKVGDRLLVSVLAVIALTSLVASQMMLSVDSSASYFMMPFRGFELAIGALLVFTKGFKPEGNLGSGASIAGILMIIASAFYLNSESPFPGLSALVPCIGAALCIQFGASSAAGFLRVAPMVRIGVISYSVYLVHWPILVFAKYYLYRELSGAESIGLFLLSIAAGHALYSMVEKPFIDMRRAGKVIPLAAIASTVALIVVGSVSLMNSGGAPDRVPEKYADFIDDPAGFHVNNFGGAGFGTDPDLGEKGSPASFLVAGDSFAMQYSYGLNHVLKERGLGAKGQYSLGCFLSRTHTRFSNGAAKPECQARYLSIIKYLRTNDRPLVLSMNWSGYSRYISDLSGNNVTFSTEKEYEELITNSLIEFIEDAGERDVYIIGVSPFLETPTSSASCLLRPRYINQPCEDRLKYKKDSIYAYNTNKALNKFAMSNDRTYFIDPAEALCKNEICSSVTGDKILFSDSVHLSKEGSVMVAKIIADKLEAKRPDTRAALTSK